MQMLKESKLHHIHIWTKQITTEKHQTIISRNMSPPQCAQYHSNLHLSPNSVSPLVLLQGNNKEQEENPQEFPFSLQTPSPMSSILMTPLSNTMTKTEKGSEELEKQGSDIYINIPENAEFLIPSFDDFDEAESLDDDDSHSNSSDEEELCKIFSSSHRPRPAGFFLRPRPRRTLPVSKHGMFLPKKHCHYYPEEQDEDCLLNHFGNYIKPVPTVGRRILTGTSRASGSCSFPPYRFSTLRALKNQRDNEKKYERAKTNYEDCHFQ